ncbi:M20/M25/M40 family metallo-hydrolase [Massilia sp. ML15P13]|uniref:M20/M25/M40 family metallo-hydrolase n=1 Tax=Telluria aromaticivorans TaxID=2725995 RepID=A0A7Y2P0S8_9BURK|nr:M20/M25/M40 family metallo-hydrolase [Telluria aromaticivorans]NNG24538.1 M20/M25/M40 family metallo-hydrolase [Telluria aromaticivorans]
MPHARISSSLLAALLAVAAGSAAAAAASPAAPDVKRQQPQINKILAEISPKRIEGYVAKLVSFGTRHTMSETESETRGIGAARRWIKAELESCGAGTPLQVAFDSHIAPVSARISRPTEIVNVVATLPGTQAASKDRIYVTSGHYDSRVTDVMNYTADAPGANDDASGTAAAMELACVMAKYKFDATIVFMAVAAEEQGLLGARHWAEQARKNNLNVAGMYTNDIIGSSRADNGKVDNKQVRLFSQSIPATKEMSEAVRQLVATGGDSDSLSRQLARHTKEQGERYVKGFKVSVIHRADRYLRGGDHMPFLEQGYAALRFTEPAEDFAHQHQDLRTENGKVYGDLVEFNDYDYIARVTKVNAAALASLALAPAAPQNVKLRTDKLTNDSTLVWQANAEPDLAGYRIVWRETTASNWQGAKWVGNVVEATVDLSKDNVFFGVQAVDKDGNVSVATYPLPQR